MNVVTICTDFGSRDWYVGAMKGEILSRCPQATLVDITHDIAPGDVEEGAFVLEGYHLFFPPGTVHLLVVDPGVGGNRRAIAVSSKGMYYVGPDNGILESVFSSSGGFVCRELTTGLRIGREVSHTFHGRDIFAPAAAHLAAGHAAAELGPEIDDPVRLSRPAPVRGDDGSLTGRVLHIDRFGNVITDITAADLQALGADPALLRVSLAGQDVEGLNTHYTQAQPGKLLALVGSHGRLEVAVSGASASELLGALHGASVRVWLAGSSVS